MAIPLIPKPAEDWVQAGDGWVPPGHPLAQTQAKPAATPAPTLPVLPSGTPARPSNTAPSPNVGVKPTAPTPTMPKPAPDWVAYGDGWVPPTHPLITGVYDRPNLVTKPATQPVVPSYQAPGATASAAAGQTAGVSSADAGGDTKEYPPIVGAAGLETLPYLSTLDGFDHNKLANPNHMTIKYQLGRLFARYPPTPAGMEALVKDPDFQRLGVQAVGGGNIRLSDGTVVDVIQKFQQGGGRWWWGYPDATTGTTPTPGGTAPGGTSPGGTYPGGTGATPGSAGYSWNGETWVDNATGYIWNGSAWVPVAGGASSYVPGMGTTAPGSYDIPGYGSDVTSSEFTDPTTANLESLLNWRINELINPINDPARQQYADLIQQYIQSLSQTDPAITNLIGSLESQAKNYLTHSAFETIGNEEISRLAGLDPQYQAAANKRLGQLEADPYTGAEWEMYRTATLDPIERDRTAARDRALAEISARGFDPQSGIAQQMLREVDRAFDENRAREQGNLGRARVEQRMARQGEAFDAQTAMDALLNSRRTQRTDLAQTLADWTANRGERAAQLYGTLAEIPTARAQQQLQGAQTLDALSQSVRGEEQSRRSEALALQGLLAELPERRLQLALATLGEGSTPESMMNSLAQLAGLSNQRQATSAAQSQANWTGIGSLASLIGSLFNKPNTQATT
jgi:hypothetical protein